ncbi:glycosyltransferase [Rudaeicoccus suwonensis]|uniref:glycosyltransferase n=1 Tax=Rudaeicoccus suwonensis TaxID=657409 RepID=UPI001476E586|nr:glycosyltransferase [Rudaeicoccus suwonensis]
MSEGSPTVADPEARVTAPPAVTKCAVVVVNFGSHRLLRTNLVPLHEQDPELIIVVVDNYSGAVERRAIRDLCEEHGWHLVCPPGNPGFGAGVNRGVVRALELGADQVLMLNPDARIDQADLDILRAAVAAAPLTMVAPVIRRPDGSVWSDGHELETAVGRIRSVRTKRPVHGPVVPWLSGACLLISRELWSRVGGFDERFFLYWEDVDLSVRVQEAGGEVTVMHDAEAVHDEGGTQHRSSDVAKSTTYYRYMVRNRLLFVGIHGDRRQAAAWLRSAPQEAWQVVLQGGRRQLLASPMPVIAAGRGLIDGAGRLFAARRGRRAESVTDSGPADAATSTDRIVVLQSVPRPRPTTNPYNVMLADELRQRPDVDLRMFSWREALTQRHAVFHAHWPEILVAGPTPMRRAVRQMLFTALLLKWTAQHTAIVRTVHNLELPEGISRRERLLLQLFERRTVGRVRLNPQTPVPADTPVATIVHGHYRPWYAPFERPASEPGRLTYFGLLRRYKGLDTLIAAFGQTVADHPELTLAIAGKPSSVELAQSLLDLAADDPRISLQLDFLDTRELVEHVSRAEIVVLPHTHMHNSGSALAALSLDRPVLMQDNEVNRQLSNEVGPGWVHLYAGALTGEVLCDALDRLRREPPAARPDLSAREWAPAAQAHVDLYRRSVAAVSSRTLSEVGGRQ